MRDRSPRAPQLDTLTGTGPSGQGSVASAGCRNLNYGDQSFPARDRSPRIDLPKPSPEKRNEKNRGSSNRFPHRAPSPPNAHPTPPRKTATPTAPPSLHDQNPHPLNTLSPPPTPTLISLSDTAPTCGTREAPICSGLELVVRIWYYSPRPQHRESDRLDWAANEMMINGCIGLGVLVTVVSLRNLHSELQPHVLQDLYLQRYFTQDEHYQKGIPQR
uniref:Uncharacterized protein n=1 Tax=Ananas comosus var. bracteatus TaxID=296719 RepID=A0A6V7P9D4_ANACO|nr:unnamed protein product [Ananas comosus var. bracteatus]